MYSQLLASLSCDALKDTFNDWLFFPKNVEHLPGRIKTNLVEVPVFGCLSKKIVVYKIPVCDKV